MITTGISKLDQYLKGGIPRGKSLVYYIQPGVEGVFFGMKTMYSTLRHEGTGVYVISSTSSDIIRHRFKELGWWDDSFLDRFFIVDAYSPLIEVPSRETYVIPKPDNIEDFRNSIQDLLKKLPPSTFVFDSLSTIMDLCGEQETIQAVRTWNRMAALYHHVMIYNFTAWSYSKETLDQIKHEIFDAVITIGGISDRVIFSQYFGILKLTWRKEMKKPIRFNLGEKNDFIGATAPFPKPVPFVEYAIKGPDIEILDESSMSFWPVF